MIYGKTGVPILFDVFHDELNSSGLSMMDALAESRKTWQHQDGIPMIDYSYPTTLQQSKVRHTESIDISHFKHFLITTQPLDFDVMLEIKDKEVSALKAVEIARNDRRFFRG
jgi:UV DNA damage endonuclease